MLKKIVALILLTTFLISCGSKRSTGKIATRNAEAVSVIKKHYSTETDFNTVSGKLRAVYQDAEKTQSVNLSFRMAKDKAIWMSASILGFPIAKAYITPTSVSYYEKVSQTYFEGDFSLVSDFLGTPLDFQKLQNLLIGQAIYDLRNEEFDFTQSPRGFQFVRDDAELMKKMFLLNPVSYKAKAQQLIQDKANRGLTVTYEDYQEVGGLVFPENIRIIASEGSNSTNIDLTYRSITFNEEVSFPFDIPSGYEEISLK
ncbi:DUF4292 domain-containing protein [Christiangramia sabulilitoris]|uniref:DUF4292 domain-containing protein n=1 Tax=Christiangramia sabulilitoris TaxID=2583991 RepID=A0A550I8N7_9FLAO|nr:DUF4292 domain-containing protein [Christiangramia sabulilitoris]TRO67337.1 DUF4292 domain-containing protein [Christiangramia sabulilitoris]